MKTLITSIVLAAATATSAMAFDSTTSTAGLYSELWAAELVVDLKADNDAYGEDLLHAEEYQMAKADLKADFYGIGAFEPIMIDGARVKIKDLIPLLTAEIASRN